MHANDLTNQELLAALTEQLGVITDNMVTKDDLKGFATKDDLKVEIARLERKVTEGQAINIQHHLATREMIGDLNRQYTHLREGLAHAGEPI